MPTPVTYGTYKLSRLISVEAIVSADYIFGTHVARNPHIHKEAWEFLFCIDNVMHVMDGETSVTLKKGEAYFVRPGTVHDVLVNSDDSRIFVVSFTCSGGNLLEPLEGRIISMRSEEQLICEQMRLELEEAFVKNPGNLHLYTFEPSETSPFGSEQLICCFMEQLIILLLRDLARQGSPVPKTSEIQNLIQDYFITRVNTYIASNFDKPLDVKTIAEQFHYSRTRFSTLYKKLTGKGVSEAVSEIRINCAKELLQRGDTSIGSIAEQCGFSSMQYFSHKFSGTVGMSPTEYAARHKERIHTDKLPEEI